MAVDHIHSHFEPDTRAYLDHPQVVEALRNGDIRAIMQALPAGVTRADVEEYLKQRFTMLDQAVWQNTVIKSGAAEVGPPDLQNHFATTSSDRALTDTDHATLQQMFGMGRAARAADAPPSDNGGAPGATPDDSSNMAPVPPSASEQAQQNLQNFSQQALDDISSELDKIDPFLKTMEDQIFDMQLLTALKDKRDELRRELRRIFSLARKGLIQPELVLVAMAKAQISEQGFIFSQLGRKMMSLNSEQSAIAKSIGAIDPSNVGEFEVRKQKMGEMGISINQIMQQMQRSTQNIESVMSSSKSMLEEYNRTKLDIIRKVAAGAA